MGVKPLTALTFCTPASTTSFVGTLALDTSTAAGSVALRTAGEPVAARSGDRTRPHATRLPGDLFELLSDRRTTLADLTLLAVGLGPGAFTGLRVGLATMQGLAFATGLPIVGVSGLDALASVAACERGSRTGTVAVWLDGARREVFAARYRAEAGQLFGVVEVGEALAGSPGSVLERWMAEAAAPPDTWIGSGAELYGSVLESRLGSLPQIVRSPLLAPVIAELAERALRAGHAVSPHALRPIYVRRPDAELAREQGRVPPLRTRS
jgi:tRNA threonylcarbamoyladenosine biosynthesis protein TsaB